MTRDTYEANPRGEETEGQPLKYKLANRHQRLLHATSTGQMAISPLLYRAAGEKRKMPRVRGQRPRSLDIASSQSHSQVMTPLHANGH
jgi:hypothetical protein